MRRRRLLAATAATFSIPLVAGCSRDDGGDGGGDGGGSGPYGMVGAGERAAAVGPEDPREPEDGQRDPGAPPSGEPAPGEPAPGDP